MPPRIEPDWSTGVTDVDDAALAEINRLWTIVQAFSNAAHTINNALQIAGGRAELIEMRETIDPDVRTRVRAIRAQGERVAAVVDQLLTYSRGEAAERVAVDIVATMHTALEMRAHPLSRARVSAAFEGDATTPVWVQANRRALLQLVLNLLVMAEHRLAGKEQARIALGVSGGPEVVTLRMHLGGVGHEDRRQPGSSLGQGASHERVVRHLASSLDGRLDGVAAGEAGAVVQVHFRPAVSPG